MSNQEAATFVLQQLLSAESSPSHSSKDVTAVCTATVRNAIDLLDTRYVYILLLWAIEIVLF